MREFVHVCKKQEWLAKMAGGNLNRAGAIVDTLRRALKVEDSVNGGKTPQLRMHWVLTRTP